MNTVIQAPIEKATLKYIEIGMRLHNGISLTFFALLFVGLSGGYLITMIPAGPTFHVNAEVVSRTSKSGATGNTGVLICVLENGNKITIDVPAVATIQTGDTVVLDSYDRYLISPKYSFAGKLLKSS